MKRQITIAFMEDKGAITVRAEIAQVVEGMNLDYNLCSHCAITNKNLGALILGMPIYWSDVESISVVH